MIPIPGYPMAWAMSLHVVTPLSPVRPQRCIYHGNTAYFRPVTYMSPKPRYIPKGLVQMTGMSYLDYCSNSCRQWDIHIRGTSNRNAIWIAQNKDTGEWHYQGVLSNGNALSAVVAPGDITKLWTKLKDGQLIPDSPMEGEWSKLTSLTK